MATLPHDRRFWSVGRLVPAVLVLGLVLDTASRFISYDAVAFRAWEAVERNWQTGLGGGFEPNKHFETTRAYGVASVLGNAPDVREIHTEVFTTDADGFRNPWPWPRPLAGLAFGSSFIGGCSLSDDETLPARLGDRVGGFIFNGFGMDSGSKSRWSALLDRLGLRDGVVVSEYLEKYALPDVAQLADGGSGASRLDRLFGSHARAARLAKGDVLGWLGTSPLAIVIRRGWKRLQDDRVLPNSYARGVVRETLRNGAPILFLPEEVAAAATAPARPTKTAVASWLSLRAMLEARGLRLLVVLVPTQFTVYAPLSQTPHPEIARDDFLERLEAELRRAGVDVVNVTEPLRRAAREGLPDGRYVYWRDDNHWNPAGVEVAADEIARHWPAPRAK